MIDKKTAPEDINTIESGEQLEYDNAEDFGEPLQDADKAQR